MSLFLLECKKILKSYIYFAFIGVMVLFYAAQMGTPDMEAVKKYSSPPEKTDVTAYYTKYNKYPYGVKKAEVSLNTVPQMIKKLYNEFKVNEYMTYPMGFLKNVKLNETKQKEVEKILVEISGESISKLDVINNANYMNPSFPINSSLTIERFKEVMWQLDNLLGGGSSYSKKSMEKASTVPVTFEEAVQNYEFLLKKDKITGGYARLFCDYTGIVLAIFPIFVVVSAVMKDKRSKMEELIFCRRISSVKLIFTRYSAMVFMMILPVVIMSFVPLIAFMRYSSQNIVIDNLAFVKYILWWLLPTLMFVTALGVAVTTITNNPIAIALQLFLWFINLANTELTGDYPIWTLIIRHNDSEMGSLVMKHADAITMNRIVILIASFLLIAFTSYIYGQKRRGKLGFKREYRKLVSFSESKSKA